MTEGDGGSDGDPHLPIEVSGGQGDDSASAERDVEFDETIQPEPSSSPVLKRQPLAERILREQTRARLAMAMMGLFGAVILSVVIALLCGADPAVGKEILTLTVSPLVGLVGVVFGFYFGSKDTNR